MNEFTRPWSLSVESNGNWKFYSGGHQLFGNFGDSPDLKRILDNILPAVKVEYASAMLKSKKSRLESIEKEAESLRKELGVGK